MSRFSRKRAASLSWGAWTVPLLLAALWPAATQAHEEIPGTGVQNFTRILEGRSARYRLKLMHSPSLPTAGDPTNLGIDVMKLLPVPDPFLGSEVPVTEPPEISLLDQKSRRVVVPHLPLHGEGEAGVYGVAEYAFPRSGSFLLHVVIRGDDGETLEEDFPITVQTNAAALFRLWVNLSVAILILGLTGMQLWKVRARGGEKAQMIRPAVVGLVCLVVTVVAMDRFILGAVLDLRKPPPATAVEEVVTLNEDGSYSITEVARRDLGLELAEVKEVLLGEAVSAYGAVEARPDLTAIVQAPLWGRIEFAKGPLAVGDRVTKGQELVHVVLELNALERGAMEAKDRDIKGAKKRAEDRRNAARLEYDRWRALNAKHPVYEADENWAKQLFDQATADYNEILRQDTAYQAVMKFRDPRRTPVIAPIDGVITSVDFVPGELNETANYRNLFTITDPRQVWVRAQVYLADVHRLHDGDSVRVFPAGDGSRAVPGRIRWIADTIDPVNRTAAVLVDVPNEGGVFPLGSFARLEFSRPRKVLAVPEQAVVDEGMARWVYVLRQEGTFAPVPVETGWKENGWWEITSGLMAGDRIIAKGAALLGSLSLPQEELLGLESGSAGAGAAARRAAASSSHQH